MKKLLFASAALVALIGTSAFAADMAAPVYKAPPPPPPVWSWTGFYIGLNGGGTWDKDHLTGAPADAGTAAFWGLCSTAATCPFDYGNGSTGTSGEFGGQAGYNWQVSNFLIGIETDAQWTNAKSNSAVSLANTGTVFVPFAGQATSKLEWFGTTRVRLGVVPTPNWLLYGTGGVAYGSIARNWTAAFTSNGPVVGSDTQEAVGWAAGVGTEWMFAQHWTAGVEWLYMKFESNTFGATGSGNPGCTATDCNFNVHSSGLQADVLRAKINYKF